MNKFKEVAIKNLKVGDIIRYPQLIVENRYPSLSIQNYRLIQYDKVNKTFSGKKLGNHFEPEYKKEYIKINENSKIIKKIIPEYTKNINNNVFNFVSTDKIEKFIF